MVRLFTLQSKPSSDYNKHSMAGVNMRVISNYKEATRRVVTMFKIKIGTNKYLNS